MRWWSLVAFAWMLTACGSESESGPAHPGEQTYTRYCFSCHAAGVAGAPKLGDVDAWTPRIARGREALVRATVKGIPPAMPPRGLCSGCSQEDLADAVDYMIERSQPEGPAP